MNQTIEITLPEWIPSFLSKHPKQFGSLQQRMTFVLELTRYHIHSKTGGPFGAAVFEQKTGQLISVGVNRVVPLSLSSMHAEVVALSFAQQHIQHYDLGADSSKMYQLVVNAQMCTMCAGAVCWSGVQEVVYAANQQDVESITGFDEGPTIADLQNSLTSRGITVKPEFMRVEGIQLLEEYCLQGGIIYNARQSET